MVSPALCCYRIVTGRDCIFLLINCKIAALLSWTFWWGDKESPIQTAKELQFYSYVDVVWKYESLQETSYWWSQISLYLHVPVFVDLVRCILLSHVRWQSYIVYKYYFYAMLTFVLFNLLSQNLDIDESKSDFCWFYVKRTC